MQRTTILWRGSGRSPDLRSRAFSSLPSASWLNQVERFFALLTQRQLRRGVHRSVGQLQDAIQAYIDANNVEPKPFRWTKTAADILASIERFCLRSAELTSDRRTSGLGH